MFLPLLIRQKIISYLNNEHEKYVTLKTQNGGLLSLEKIEDDLDEVEYWFYQYRYDHLEPYEKVVVLTVSFDFSSQVRLDLFLPDELEKLSIQVITTYDLGNLDDDEKNRINKVCGGEVDLRLHVSKIHHLSIYHDNQIHERDVYAYYGNQDGVNPPIVSVMTNCLGLKNNRLKNIDQIITGEIPKYRQYLGNDFWK